MDKIEEKNLEARKEKVKTWLKNPYNLILVGILIFTFAIRLFFFIKTNGQPLWFDEAEYMSAAKHWAFGVPYDLNPQRPPLFQFLAALSFMAGLGESFIKFALVLVPSVFLVFFVYLLGKEMYNKKIGLIAAFLASVSWTFIFWTARIQPDFLSMCFQVLTILFMWKYWKHEKTNLIIYAGIFAALGFYFKVSALLVPMSFMLFILIKDRLSAFSNKNYYYFSLAFLGTLIPYFIWSYSMFGTFTAFKTGYSNAIGTTTPFAWHVVKFFYLLTENIFFILFIVGLIITIKFVLYADVLLKDKKKCFDPGLFSIIVLMITTAFYIFYIRGVEDRWVFLWMPFIFMIIGVSLDKVYKLIGKHTKIIAAVVVIALLAVGGYMQYGHANSLIENKIASYQPVKDAALWIKDNSDKNDKVLSISYTQTVYYSEGNVSTYSLVKSTEEFNAYLDAAKPRFMIISVFEPHPQWAYTWPNETNSRPVQAYFADADKKQPVLIIYELIY